MTTENRVPNPKNSTDISVLNVWQPGLAVTLGDGNAASNFGQFIGPNQDDPQLVDVIVTTSGKEVIEHWHISKTFAQT